MTHRPSDPDFESRVRASFDRQAAMRLIGAELAVLAPGHAVIELPFRPDLTQQHGPLICLAGRPDGPQATRS